MTKLNDGHYITCTVYVEIFARRKFSPISPSALNIGDIFIVQFFVLYTCVNDYIEDMATFTALAKIYFTEYFCNAKVAGLGESFVQ